MLAALFLTMILGVALWLSELIRRGDADADARANDEAGATDADADADADDPNACRRKRGGALICCAIRYDEHPGRSGALSPVATPTAAQSSAPSPVRLTAGVRGVGVRTRHTPPTPGAAPPCSAVREAMRRNGTRAVLHTSSAAEIARTLTANRNRLMSVDLRSNRLTAECAKLLAAGIRGDTTLIGLNLHHNALGSDGVAHLARALRGSKLQRLDVSDNGMEWRGVWALSVLLVGGVDAIDWAAAAAGPAASTDATARDTESNGGDSALQQLNVSDNFVDDEGLQLLAAALTRNRSLTSLRAERAGCGDTGLRAFASKLKHFTAPLRELTLDDNDHAQAGCNAIVGALQATPRPAYSPTAAAAAAAADRDGNAPPTLCGPVGCAHVPLERLSLWSGALDWSANERVRVGVTAALRVNAATRQRVVWNTMRVAVTASWMRANYAHPLRNSVLPVVANCILPFACAPAGAAAFAVEGRG